MEETTSREQVLKKVRSALINKNENPYPSLDSESSVFHDFSESPDITFASEFTRAAGKFIYCENQADLKSNLSSLIQERGWEQIHCPDPAIRKNLEGIEIPIVSELTNFDDVKVGITPCEYLVARFGSIMISSQSSGGRRINIFPDTHIVFAHTEQIVPEIKDALNAMQEKYEGRLPSMISLITGPSRTADIEKTLVMGAHGPKELYVFLLDNE